jgi:hypothetical protein
MSFLVVLKKLYKSVDNDSYKVLLYRGRFKTRVL